MPASRAVMWEASEQAPGAKYNCMTYSITLADTKRGRFWRRPHQRTSTYLAVSDPTQCQTGTYLLVSTPGVVGSRACQSLPVLQMSSVPGAHRAASWRCWLKNGHCSS